MKKKTLALALAAVLTFGAVIGGTVAWLTAQSEQVNNTFTVGDINIKLDEADVNEYGELLYKTNVEGKLVASEEELLEGETMSAELADRVQANEYKMIPGSKYVKDPKVTVLANSEPCYVFIKVTEINNDADIILWGLNTDNWISVSGEDNVYVYSTDGSTAAVVPTYTADQMLESIIKTVTDSSTEPNTKEENVILINSALTKEDIEKLDGKVDEKQYSTQDEIDAAVAEEIAARPKLTFDAYAVQAANMADANAAWSNSGFAASAGN